MIHAMPFSSNLSSMLYTLLTTSILINPMSSTSHCMLLTASFLINPMSSASHNPICP